VSTLALRPFLVARRAEGRAFAPLQSNQMTDTRFPESDPLTSDI